MSEGSSITGVQTPGSPKDVRARDLDDIDRRILLALHDDARIPNSALAEMVGIAPSTCHGRVRRLQEIGVIRGFYTDIDPAAVGLGLQAMISVSLQSNARGKIRSFIAHIRTRPQVMDVLPRRRRRLHPARGRPRHRGSPEVRGGEPQCRLDVAGTQTSLIFEHLRGASPL